MSTITSSPESKRAASAFLLVLDSVNSQVSDSRTNTICATRKKGHKNSFPPRNQISDGRKNGRVKNTVFGPEAIVRDYDCFTICQHVVLCELGISFFIADVLYCTILHIPTIKSQSYKPPLLLCLCLGFIVCRHGDLAYFSHFPRPHTSLFATYVASKASKLWWILRRQEFWLGWFQRRVVKFAFLSTADSFCWQVGGKLSCTKNMVLDGRKKKF